MSAVESIRRAALTLENRVAIALPEPWIPSTQGDALISRAAPAREIETKHYGGAVVAESMTQGTRGYIRRVHPGVGKELAAWLHLIATRCEQLAESGQSEPVIAANVLGYDQALAVANAVLRVEVPA